MWVSIEKQAHDIIKTYIQPIVLQEGVHTIHHCTQVCQQRESCIHMYDLVSKFTDEGRQLKAAKMSKNYCESLLV